MTDGPFAIATRIRDIAARSIGIASSERDTLDACLRTIEHELDRRAETIGRYYRAAQACERFVGGWISQGFKDMSARELHRRLDDLLKGGDPWGAPSESPAPANVAGSPDDDNAQHPTTTASTGEVAAADTGRGRPDGIASAPRSSSSETCASDTPAPSAPPTGDGAGDVMSNTPGATPAPTMIDMLLASSRVNDIALELVRSDKRLLRLALTGIARRLRELPHSAGRNECQAMAELALSATEPRPLAVKLPDMPSAPLLPLPAPREITIPAPPPIGCAYCLTTPVERPGDICRDCHQGTPGRGAGR